MFGSTGPTSFGNSFPSFGNNATGQQPPASNAVFGQMPQFKPAEKSAAFSGGFATQEQTNLSSFTGSNQPLASKFGSPFGSNPIGNSKFGSTAHSTSSTGKFSGLNQNITQDSQGRYYGPNVCRMCGKQFPSAPELKLHIKSEGHFDTANAAAPSAPHAADPLGNNFSHQPRQPYTHEFKSSAGHSSQASKPSVPVMHMDELPSKQSMSTRLSAESLSDLGRRRKEFIPHSTSESIMSDGSTSNHDSNMKDQAMDETAEREKSLRELLRNKLKNNKEDNKVNPVKAESAISVVSKSKPLPKISNPIRSKTIHHDNDPLDFDRGRRPDGRAMCEDMCPEEERERRSTEYGALHDLERINPDIPEFSTLQKTMIKRFQKSAADHDLNVPELVRTPRALLATIVYIENNLLHLFENYDPEETTPIVVYLFIWDRFRMIAKDFTLMNSAMGVNAMWIECHERMARWYVYMDHRMKCEEDYMSAGHGQQNGESLNNIFKTLVSLYSLGESCSDGGPIESPNKGEFIGYFIIFQIGNKGEITKFLQSLHDDYFESGDVQFAIKVWRAIKSENHIAFFKLLQSATLLQACMMHKYVSEVRITALKKMCKSYAVPSGGGSGAQGYYPLKHIMDVLMFEDENETREFMNHCNIEIYEDDFEEGPCILFENQNIYSSLPVDKNNNSILPKAQYMWNSIEKKRTQCNIPTIVSDEEENDESNISIRDICRGYASAATRFPDDLCIQQRNQSIQPTAQKSVMKPSNGYQSMMSDTNNKNNDADDYELSSQDSDDDAETNRPFPLLPGPHPSPPMISSLMSRKKSIQPMNYEMAPMKSMDKRHMSNILSQGAASAPETKSMGSSDGKKDKDGNILKLQPPSVPFMAFSDPLKMDNELKKPSLSLSPPIFSSNIGKSAVSIATNNSNMIMPPSESLAEEIDQKKQEEHRLAVEKEKQEMMRLQRLAKENEEREAKERQQRLELEREREGQEKERLNREKERERQEKEREEARKMEELRQQERMQEEKECQEKLKQIEREKQREEELIRIEKERQRLEYEESLRLDDIYQQYHRQVILRQKKKIFEAWTDHTIQSKGMMRRMIVRYRWNQWMKAIEVNQQKRRAIDKTLSSIQINGMNPWNQKTMNRFVPSQSYDKKRKLENSSYELTSYAISKVKISKKNAISMTKAVDLLFQELLSDKSHRYQLGNDYHDSLIELFSPIHLSHLLGSQLLHQQCLQVQRYMDQSQSYGKDRWNKNLYHKVVLLSSSIETGLWHHETELSHNLIRLLLCTHHMSSNKHILGLWKDYIDCQYLSESHDSPLYRHIQIVVSDIGLDYNNHDLNTFESPLQGMQSMILVLSIHEQHQWDSLPFLSDIMKKYHQGYPLSIVLTNIDSNHDAYEYIDILDRSNHRQNYQMNKIYVHALNRLESIMNINIMASDHIPAIFVIESKQQQQSCLNINPMVSLVQTIRQCLVRLFDRLANDSNHHLQFPLLQGFQPKELLHDAIISTIFTINHQSNRYEDLEECLLHQTKVKIEDCIDAFETMLNDLNYRIDFPAKEFVIGDEMGSMNDTIRDVLYENLTYETSCHVSRSWQHDASYHQPLRKAVQILQDLNQLFSKKTAFREMRLPWNQTRSTDLSASSNREKRRYLQRIVEYYLDSLPSDGVIVSIPKNILQKENILLNLLGDGANDVIRHGIELIENPKIGNTMDGRKIEGNAEPSDEKADEMAMILFDKDNQEEDEEDNAVVENQLSGSDDTSAMGLRHIADFTRYVSKELAAESIFLRRLERIVEENDDNEDTITQHSLISSDDSMNCKDINDVYKLLNQLEKERVQTDRRLEYLVSENWY